MLVGISLVVIVGFIGSMFYGRYQHFIENRFLGKQHSVDELVQTFGQRLVTRLTLEQLVGLLSDEVMPGLRIKQGALLRFHGFDGFSPPNDVEVLCSVEVEPDLLPDPLDVMALLAHAGQYRPPPEEGVNVRPCSWVRLTLPLKHEGRVIGMCLMGERTPDNFYSYSEIPILQALIDQTSLALMNIEQANLLLQLSRRELARYESERLNMAHELHDEVLAQMAVLAQSMSVPSDAFLQSYQDAVQRIRNVISGLRPATLEQLGLQTALEELLDDLTERSEHMEGVDPLLELDLTPDRSRYDHEVELHLFRIVQQASYNVLEHAQAQKLTICGRLEQDIVELEVIDDGVGFQNGNPADFGSLLAHQHFGLVTMHERANLIGAHVEITSTPGEGTRVKVIWREQESRAGIGNVAEQSSE
jgi:signal transduction histidine kinase